METDKNVKFIDSDPDVPLLRSVFFSLVVPFIFNFTTVHKQKFFLLLYMWM